LAFLHPSYTFRLLPNKLHSTIWANIVSINCIFSAEYHLIFSFTSGGRTNNNIGYKKTYYLSRLFQATWVDAKTICKAFDLELATFETSDEASNFINRESVKNFFDGFDDHFVFVDGVGLTPKSLTDWYWTNSGEKIPYSMQWNAGEPNYHQNYEYCLSIGKISKNEKIGFNDYRCWEYPKHFICQKTEMTA